MNSANNTLPHFTPSWWLLWGFVLILVGLVAIGFVTFTTLISVIFVGALIFAGGVIMLIDAFRFWHRHWGSFLMHCLISILYIVLGILLMEYPIAASVPLTLLIGLFYLFIGLFRVIYSMTTFSFYWGWSLFSGMVSLFLGILIIANWPASSLFIIGLFVGIDLLICGWTYMLIALAGRSLVRS